MDEREHMRRCLIRQLLAWRHERGLEWLRSYVAGMPMWPQLKDDFARQWRNGNRGEKDKWI